MVFAASLNVPVKKALKKIVISSNVNKICENLILDPDTTKMTCVILGPKDFVGPKEAQLRKSLNNKHPNICVIYLYTSDDESDLCPNAYTERSRKITDKVVKAAFEKYASEHADETGQRAMSSADFDPPEDTYIPTARGGGSDIEPGDDEDEWSTTHTHSAASTPGAGMGKGPMSTSQIPPMVSLGDDYSDDEPDTDPAAHIDIPYAPADTLPTQPLNTETQMAGLTAMQSTPGALRSGMEERMAAVNSYQEWPVFKESLRHDALVQELVLQNSEYEGLVQMLEVLDTRIQAVWRDSTLTPEQKFTEIKAIGLQKSSIRAGVNSINVDKAISIISTIVLSAQRTVDERLDSIDAAMYKVTGDMNQIADTSYIDKAIQQRTKLQFELLEIGKGILDIYKSCTNFLTAEIQELDKNLPSSNAIINDMTSPIGMQIFTPQNTQELVKKISTALQENKLIWSQLEDRVDECINSMFELCQADEKIIQYQQHVIETMRTNRVENVIIADTLLKRVLRLYVGADNTGRSATAITWSGVLSRRGNTLLIDLTARSKFRDYGITPVLLGEFMSSRIERPLLCVETRGKLNAQELSEMVSQIRTRLNYYQYVNVIVAPEDIETLKLLSEEAFIVHYITNCSTASIQQMKGIVTSNTVQQIARKLVIIDTPISPLSIADSIGIDPSNTKLIPLPALNEIRACALKHDRPYDYPEIVRIFEEAFR